MNARRLVAVAGEGNETASALLDRYARNVSVGIANLQQTMAPNFFILHGDVVGGGPVMTEAIDRHVRQLVPTRPGGEVEIVAGDAEDVAALRGAAGLVLSEALQFAV
ncbi:ROK family protein [Faunimonas pinastri]|uniref:ROK family protein n=2 Tax=Faunimonas pinastri TaxID=1855383 RepID=A0A1H9Q174_9HYPH|nr:ROK family protein [Faunimonas pinastri]